MIVVNVNDVAQQEMKGTIGILWKVNVLINVISVVKNVPLTISGMAANVKDVVQQEMKVISGMVINVKGVTKLVTKCLNFSH